MSSNNRRKLPASLRTPRPGTKPGSPEWMQWVRDTEQYLGYSVCAAHAGTKLERRELRGHPCSNPPLPGRKRCNNHGGPSLAGPASPNWKHGGRSLLAKAMPKHMRQAYNASLYDPQLLSLRADIALADARRLELVQRLGSSESTNAWEQLQELYDEMLLSMAESDGDGVTRLMQQWGALLDGAREDAATHAELRRLADHRRKLVNTERVRLEALQAMMTPDRVAVIVGRITHTLATHVPRQYLGPVVAEMRTWLPADARNATVELGDLEVGEALLAQLPEGEGQEL